VETLILVLAAHWFKPSLHPLIQAHYLQWQELQLSYEGCLLKSPYHFHSEQINHHLAQLSRQTSKILSSLITKSLEFNQSRLNITGFGFAYQVLTNTNPNKEVNHSQSPSLFCTRRHYAVMVNPFQIVRTQCKNGWGFPFRASFKRAYPALLEFAIE
jgi:hypothetical protein